MISVIVPTCHRPEMFRSMLKSLEATTKGYDVEILAVIDEDTESLNIAELYGAIVNYSTVKRGALYGWNLALAMSTGEYIVPCGDDQLFYPNWLDYALESHKEKLDNYGVVGMNDLAYDGNAQLATMFIFDREFCRNIMGGIFAPPMYNYYCIDSEWNAKAKGYSRFYWDSRSIVEHLHSSHGKRPIDGLDKEKMDAGWMEIDNATLEDRKSRGFPIEWESLI